MFYINIEISVKTSNAKLIYKYIHYFRVRTRILTQEEAKDREKYFMKFIKVMRVSILNYFR